MYKRALKLSGILLLFSALSLFAAEPSFKEPILLTSCGQSADALMMKTLLMRDSLNFEYLPDATAEKVAGKGTILLVLGGSSKGLGAAKISEADELARVQAVVDAATKAEVPVIAIHMGGLNRRGALSDPFNKLGAASAAHIFVVKGGDDDGFFSKIAAEKKIPIETVATSLDLGPKMKQFFAPEPKAEAQE